MVLGRSRLTTTKPVTALSLALVALSLMFVFSGGNGRRGGIIFVEASSGSIGGGGGGGGFWSTGSHSNVGLAVAVTAMAGLALAATVIYSRRGSLKSPWSRRRRKHALLPKQWKSLFDSDGRLCDGGVKFLKKVRSGGVDPSIRAEVWPFLLGMYDLNSSKEERDSIRVEKRKEYNDLRKQCQLLLTDSSKSLDLEETSGNHCCEDSRDCSQVLDSPGLEEEVKPKGSICSEGAEDLGNSMCKGVVIPRGSISSEGAEDPGNSMCKDEVVSPIGSISAEGTEDPGDSMCEEEVVSPRGSIPTEGSKDPGNPRCNPPLQSSCVSQEGESGITCENAFESDSESSNSDDSEETENTQAFLALEGTEEDNLDEQEEKSSSSKSGGGSKHHSTEDFYTWQRIIRLDAVRANAEWVTYSPSQAAVSETKARQLADSVGLKDYDHLEPSRIFHAARLIAILEAYTLYDSEIGYCQGMSDLLSPIIAVMEEDYEAFWCFVGFMRKARHNFRLDEVGIRRQLDIVSKIIKGKDSHLYNHLEKLQAEDCFFVYRMVVVLFRRELNFEQTLCLWEVMWADQASIRAGIAKSAWGRMRLRAPPTDDLLLFAIAACVLQRRKLIVENYSSMDEIMRECNSMAGNLDVWKLLDDAHDLVVKLHDKI